MDPRERWRSVEIRDGEEFSPIAKNDDGDGESSRSMGQGVGEPPLHPAPLPSLFGSLL